MQVGSENDDRVKRTVFFNSQYETEIISKLLPIPRFKEIAAMVEILTESIIQTKDEWIQLTKPSTTTTATPPPKES